MEVIASQLFSGLSLGSILLLAALGLALTFGQLGVINMAHGEFIMVGCYTAYVVQQVVTNAGASLLISLPLAFVVAGALGVLLEWAVISRMRGRPLDTLLVTWGVALLLQQLARDIFGAPNVDVRSPEWLAGPVELLGLSMPKSRLVIIALCTISVVAVAALLVRTPLGRRIRAVVANRDLAEASGIDSGGIDRTTFFLGSGLAGIAGVALTLLGSVGPTVGQSYIVDAFLVVVIGGIGRIWGAVIAALGLGMAQSFLQLWTDASIAKVLVLVIVVVVLQARPQGLFTVRKRALA
ncbi:urea ABC transporter permease subunit UrtB [Actinomycetota bacterium]